MNYVGIFFFHRNCGEMADTNELSEENYEIGPTCASGSTIIYAWAMDADKTELPKGKLSSVKRTITNKLDLFF